MLVGVKAIALVCVLASTAAADGERTPMFGGSVVGVQAPGQDDPLAGAQLEIAFWRGRFGAAVEGARTWSTTDREVRAATVTGSLRVAVFETLVPSLLDPRDVEFGVELQGLVERSWWSTPTGRDPVAYGLGIALRLRGGSDDEFSPLLAESRLWFRVTTARTDSMASGIAARGAVADTSDRNLTFLVGLGASFGVGDMQYLQRFREHRRQLVVP
jgi:hypothetical protein